MGEQAYWTLFILFLVAVIFATIILMVMKKPYRQMQYIKIKKSLDKDNIKLITDEEDIKYLQWVLEKFEWYSKKWWVNLTPQYLNRWLKAKKIFKKYKLDIDVVQYPNEEK